MPAKELKSHLKAAKAAIDRHDFQAALPHCQDILRVDGQHYTGLVFAGLANLKLGQYEESREYYRRAVRSQPDTPLAWKGFADFYDHRKPVVKDEQLEAVDVYTKLLSFIENDTEKLRSTYLKLISLEKEFNHQDRVIECYSAVTSTYKPDDFSASCSEVWMDFSAYLVGREGISDDCWVKLRCGFPKILESVEKQALREKLVKKLYARYMTICECDTDLVEFLEEECSHLSETASQTANPIFLHLLLSEMLSSSSTEMISSPITLTEQQQAFLQSLSCVTTEGVATTQEASLVLAGQALVSIAGGNWSNARDAISKSVGYSTPKCECWCLNALLHLHHRDYKMAEQAADSGLTSLSTAAKFRVKELERRLKLWQCEAYIGSENVKLLTQALPFLVEQAGESCTSHAIVLLVRAHLLLSDLPSALCVLDTVGREVELLALRGEVYLKQQEYTAAISHLNVSLQAHPSSPPLLLTKAKVLWTDPEQDKAKAYSALLQAAKADPMNPEVFLYLGHYQRLVTGDLKRAEKCYQKAVSLQPSHPEAGVSLGDILWTSGRKEEACDVYRAVTAAALPSRTKVAWIRIGLHQKETKQFSEAVKSFQTILSSYPEDKHCWECLGEAYLARGSHNSALRTFTKCIELDPNAIQCHYQIACIKQLLGFLQESLDDYSAVLKKDPSFVPALKGKGETYLRLARGALQQNFDGKAVDLISTAIDNLTQAAQLRPGFSCVWKLLGDSCICLNPLPTSVARPLVPSILRKGRTDRTSGPELQTVEKKEVLEIGCRCYAKGIELEPEAAHLWQDLSLGYYYLSKESGSEASTSAVETALKASKKAVRLQPNCHSYWNTLGVIAACGRGLSDPALAQHCFVRSIQEEKNNAVAWTNLGALYFKQFNTELAFEAFKKAQSLSPDYAPAWIGLALIAERVGSADAMDLFRHCTELEYHPEASTGYGYWVCQTLSTVSPQILVTSGRERLTEAAHRSVVQARDNLQKLACREMADASCLNNLGLLLEQEGLLREAQRAFTQALENCQEESAVNFNLARVRSALGCTEKAVSFFKGICKDKGEDLVAWFELALAFFRQQEFEESRQTYKQLLLSQGSNLSDQDSKMSATVTAQAMVAFAQGEDTACKELLFQAFESAPVSLYCMVSLCALAGLSNDLTLLFATLQELEKILDWQAEGCHQLHHSCFVVLHTLKVMLRCNSTQTGADNSGCLDTISKILEKLPEVSHPFVAPPTPLSLHTMLTGENLKSQVQKLLHSYPNNTWALTAMASQLDSSLGPIRNAYLSRAQLLVKSELSMLSAGNASLWQRSQMKKLAVLEKWLLNA